MGGDMTEIWQMSLSEQSAAVAKGDLSPSEIVETAISRIEELDCKTNACVTLMAEAAMANAQSATNEIVNGRRLSPIHGLPVGLKDIFDTAGVLTAGGSRATQSRIPDKDATSVAKLRAAGGIILAKLTTHEFAHGGPSFDLPWPPARNPWNLEHFTGGSSSGSGAAVAAGYVAAAMGSDTGGSIRGPATYCGVAGFMPTYGLISRAGVIPNSFTFDHAGPLAWTVADCALMLDATAGPDGADPASAHAQPPNAFKKLGKSIKGLRVGLLSHFWEEDLSVRPEIIKAVEQAAAALSGAGCVVEPARIAPVQDWYDVKIVIAETELFNVHRRNLMTRPSDFGQDFLARSLGALLFTGQDYVAAQRRRRQLMSEMRTLWDRFDVLLAPSALGAAPRLDGHRAKTFWTTPSILTPFDVTAGPALNVPVGFNYEGLPLGVQLAGRPFDDARILTVGFVLEKSFGLRGLRPNLEAAPPPNTVVPVPPPPEIEISDVEGERLRAIAAAADFKLTDKLYELLAEAAPYVWAMGRRLDRDFGFSDEPMNIFMHTN
jgi:aspartyl-tRNA(Asn)/glutamyl-tRNA(Gln) amidotransferase subunit A